MKKFIGFSSFIAVGVLSLTFAFIIIPTAHAQVVSSGGGSSGGGGVACPAGFTCTPVTGTSTLGAGYIVTSLDPASPLASTVQISTLAQTQNVPLAVFDVKSQGGVSTLKSLQVNLTVHNAGNGFGSLLNTVSLKIGGKTYAGTPFTSTCPAGYTCTPTNGITFGNLNVNLPANISVPVTVYGTVAKDTNNSLDGSSVIASLVNVQGVSLRNNPVPSTGGTISGNTITFSASLVQVSNTSATLGNEVCTSSGVSCVQNVSFSFALTAGNQPIYISTSVTDTAMLAPNASIVFAAKGDVVPSKGALLVGNVSPADTSRYFYIAPGQSRQFTFSGSVDNSGCPSDYSCSNAISQISSIGYGVSTSNLSSNYITSGLSNLQVAVSFGSGPTPVCPAGYTCTPVGTTPVCPAGFTCTPVIVSCPTGFTCTTQTPTTQQPTVTITNPKGGETFIFGTPIRINWTTTGITGGNVGLYLENTSGLACSIGNPSALADTMTVTLQVNQSCPGNPYWPQGLIPGQYKVMIDAAPATGIEDTGGTSNYFTLASAPSSQPPVISGGTFPTTLTVGQQGTWIVNASDPQNGSLSYSVDWGDTSSCPTNSKCAIPKASSAFVQSASFTHSYSSAGTYTVTFTVKNAAGLTAQTTSTVQVTNVVSAVPSLNVSLDPSSPQTNIISSPQSNVTMAVIDLVAGSNSVNSMNKIQVGSDSTYASSLSNIKVYQGSTLLGTAPSLTNNGSYYYAWINVSNVSVPANVAVPLRIVADVSANTATSSQTRLGITGLNFNSPGVTVTGTPVYGSGMYFVASLSQTATYGVTPVRTSGKSTSLTSAIWNALTNFSSLF